jgi:hypothetical protein
MTNHQSRRKLAQPPLCPDLMYATMLQCWKLSPQTRPDASEIMFSIADVIAQNTVQLSSLTWPSLLTLREADGSATLRKSKTSDVAEASEGVNLLGEEEVARFAALETPQSHFHRVKPLGKGAFGEVFLAEYTPPSFLPSSSSTTTLVAVKTLKSSDSESKGRFEVEARTLCALQHDHIVRLVGVCTQGEGMWMAMEYVAHGDLLTCLRNTSLAHVFSATNSLTVLHQVASAMLYLETRGVVHRDLAAR